MRKLSIVPALAVVAVALTGCGTQTFDTDDLQTTLTEDIASQNDLKAADLTVSCPDDPKAEKGTKFTCDLKGGDVDTKVNVTVTDDDGGFDYDVVQ